MFMIVEKRVIKTYQGPDTCLYVIPTDAELCSQEFGNPVFPLYHSEEEAREVIRKNPSKYGHERVIIPAPGSCAL